MKIFCITSCVPCPGDGRFGITAVNVVCHELLIHLKEIGHELVLQVIFPPTHKIVSLDEYDQENIDNLEKNNIRVLDSIFPDCYSGGNVQKASKLNSILRSLIFQKRIEDYYPSINAHERVCGNVYSFGSDAVLTLWCPEGLAATHYLKEVPRVAYNGDLDFVPTKVRMMDSHLFRGAGARDEGGVKAIFKGLTSKIGIKNYELKHLEVMKKVNVIANVTASNSPYYSKHGHGRSIYIQNTWLDMMEAYQEEGEQAAFDEPINIIGHVGFLRSTGSMYGLRYLLEELLPELEISMAGLDYRIQVIGGGEPAESLKPVLDNGRIVMRGFVEDLDRELRASQIFLMLNNSGRYLAAFTRHVVAWSMGLCLVVHSNSVKAIPEIEHMKNALVGDSPAKIAEMIRLASTDMEINHKIRQGGRETYLKYFKPEKVAEALNREIMALVQM